MEVSVMGTGSILDPKTSVSRSRKVIRRQLVKYADVLRNFPYPGVLRALDERNPEKAYQLRLHWIRLHVEMKKEQMAKKNRLATL
jgi:hypothetical protein